MSKYKALFIEESREHLGELSRLLVDVESSPEPARLIDEIFRHAHSIKGMASSMDYGAVTHLAHRLEDVVDAWRKTNRPASKDTIDVLLRGVDALSTQVDAVTENAPPDPYEQLVAALVAAGEALHVPPTLVAPPLSAPAVVPAATRTGVASSEPRTLRLRLSANVAAPAARALLIYRQLAKIGTLIDTQPTPVELKTGELSSPELRVSIADTDEASIRKALANTTEIESIVFVPIEPSETARSSRTANENSDNAKNTATVRVRTEVLDIFINSVGELFIARERLTNLLNDVQRPELRAALDALSARIREIHDQVMAVRMMPLRTLTERLPRLVRDLSRALGKEAELEVVGSEIELDRAILDHLDAVFVHTLRNAVDHGIEPPDERTARGKHPAGKLTLTAIRDRDSVLVTIEDDGRGLDADRLRQVALTRGLISAHEGEQLSTRDCYFLVCLPGFSTKTEVSDVSGRGVNMDAVRSRIESLGGTVDIESELGRLTRFILRLPLTLAIVPVLLVEAASIVFAIPLAKVVAIREKGADVIRQPGGATYLSFQHALVAITDLAALLHLPPSSGFAEYVVVIEDGRDLAGLAVTKLVGHHEAVVKPLGEPLDRLESYSGAAILGDGHPILILDLPRALRQRVT